MKKERELVIRPDGSTSAIIRDIAKRTGYNIEALDSCLWMLYDNFLELREKFPDLKLGLVDRDGTVRYTTVFELRSA